MADFTKRAGDSDCEDGEGERGKRGKRGKRGHRGPAGPAATIVTDPTPPTLKGNGTDESPLQVINVAPQPFTSPLGKRIIFVRATGSDTTGDGLTVMTAYRTIQRGVLDVPMFIPGGVQYIVDCTDLIDGGPEIVPAQYSLPPWKAGRAFDAGDISDPTFLVQCAVNIRAEPRNVPALGADAVVAFEDLMPTVVGTQITNVTNADAATGVEVATLTPHKLFLVQDDFIQQVTITGVTGTVSANGTWFVEATGPNTFIIKGADTSADPPYAGGGIATTLFVQDQISGQIQVKVSAPRASWAPGSLKGKLFLDPNPDTNSAIYDNTNDTLFITQAFPLSIAPGNPARIAEQSAVIQCSPMTSFGFVGGFNAINQDSLALDGLAILAAESSDPDERFAGLWHQYGNVWVQACRLTNPIFTRTTQANSRSGTWMIGAEYFQTPIYQSSSLYEDQLSISGINWWDCFGGTVFLNPQTPVGIMDDGGFTGWFAIKVINPPEVGFFTSAPHGSINRLSIEGGDVGFIIDGQGAIILNGVGGTWSSAGLLMFRGGQAEITDASFNDAYSPGPNLMLVGTLPPRSFDNFRSGADGGEILNQFDVTGFNPVDPAVFGAKGTASRVFQQ